MHSEPRDYDPDVEDIAERLVLGRPIAGSSFAGRVRMFLGVAEASGLLVARPRQLWLRACGCALAGGAVLALVAAGIGGWGPFAS